MGRKKKPRTMMEHLGVSSPEEYFKIVRPRLKKLLLLLIEQGSTGWVKCKLCKPYLVKFHGLNHPVYSQPFILNAYTKPRSEYTKAEMLERDKEVFKHFNEKHLHEIHCLTSVSYAKVWRGGVEEIMKLKIRGSVLNG